MDERAPSTPVKASPINLHRLDINWAIVGGLALGGSLMAPIAARIVVNLPRKQIGILVGIAVIVINGYRILSA